MRKKYVFLPAYREWHFVEVEKPNKILLCVADPLEYICDGDGNVKNDINDICAVCSDIINSAQIAYEEGDRYNNIPEENFKKLPANAADIMATALYNYYVLSEKTV